MADEQDKAEQLDPSVLGQQPEDDELAGIDLADDERHRLNAEDISIIRGSTETDDSLAERDYRRDWTDSTPEPGIRMVEEEHDIPVLDDNVRESVAYYAEAADPDELSAEEAAVRIEEI